ncbi:PREDICTED: ATP-dependent RNA helicase DDX54 [Nicrophorus vespilloides]|uniref:RNA helicase n=1 Tax=Nicrophorus vespilloides TaxID=110193 RepID=A0ABM1NA73_NICVS|nr:PREDICTED: ATP-dependent RNA helicase DDX54 [Nicrophorus vespilloides]
MVDLPGFADPNSVDEVDRAQYDEVKKKASKKSGGFQSMGLDFNVLRAVKTRGYKIPTPIQRKTIPLVLEGRDVVAMARTGSGKTACFLLPMFEKLKVRSAVNGVRAVILSPTRELALQTLKFIRDLGKFTDLRAAVILGGDSMEQQFSVIHGNPDIIVATPGRFLHVCVEMDLKLSSVQYIVFDEADRLFEMGFGEQLNEIVKRLPDTRQTLLFSATLPKVLVEFSKAGLTDPVLIRLDVESKLPDTLQLYYISVRSEEKMAALLVLLMNHIEANQQTVVFAATKHHVAYISEILDFVGISNTMIFSNLDASARKINAAKFTAKKVDVLVVTDVAARGIDIPELDNVINYNFPAKSKLFVHRVGRCARAGRSGTAYSLVGPDEYAYLVDLQLFLGRPLELVSPTKPNGNVGRIPQTLLEEQLTTLLNLHKDHNDLEGTKQVATNGYMQYLRSRPNASTDSNKKVKEMSFGTCGIHPIFMTTVDGVAETKKESLLEQMKAYRPRGTIFEVADKKNTQESAIMRQKRSEHNNLIENYHKKAEKRKADEAEGEMLVVNSLQKSDNAEIEGAFSEVILPKKRKIDDLYKKKKAKKPIIKDENYIPYAPSDRHTEEGLVVNNFQKEASKAQMDLTGDSDEAMKFARQKKVWDRKTKKMVTIDPHANGRKIKTEHGAWIPASFKSNRYADWKERNKIEQTANSDDNDDDDDAADGGGKKGKKAPKKTDFLSGRPNTHWARHNEKVKIKKRRSELKSTDQILKERQLMERKRAKSKPKKYRNKGGGNNKKINFKGKRK